MTDSVFISEIRPQVQAVCEELVRIVQEYYADETHQREFEMWYEQKYGQPYRPEMTTR